MIERNITLPEMILWTGTRVALGVGIGMLVSRRLGKDAMKAAGLALAVWHVGLPVHAVLVAAWGMAFGAVPVGWSTWMARAVPDETESAGGILVAAVQIAIAAGAAVGGSIFSFGGVTGVFAAGGIVLLLTAGAVFARVTQTNVTKVASPSPDGLVVCER